MLTSCPHLRRKKSYDNVISTEWCAIRTIKADATPGRLNQTRFLINRPGLFYGQCSISRVCWFLFKETTTTVY